MSLHSLLAEMKQANTHTPCHRCQTPYPTLAMENGLCNDCTLEVEQEEAYAREEAEQAEHDAVVAKVKAEPNPEMQQVIVMAHVMDKILGRL